MPQPDLIVDTCIWIYQERKKNTYDLYVPDLEGKILGVSFQTYAELIVNPFDLPKWHQKFMVDRIATVIYPDKETCRLWGTLKQTCIERKMPKPHPECDMWHAATALRYQVPLVSHNTKHFEWIPRLELLSHS